MDAFWQFSKLVSDAPVLNSIFILVIALLWLYKDRTKLSLFATLSGIIIIVSTTLRFIVKEVHSINGGAIPADGQNPLVFWLYLYGFQIGSILFFIILFIYFFKKKVHIGT